MKRQTSSIVALVLCLSIDREYLLDEILGLAVENDLPVIFTWSKTYSASLLKDKVYTVCSVIQALEPNYKFLTAYKPSHYKK